MTQRSYITAKEIAEELGVSSSKAYGIIRQLNDELQSKGYLTLPGKTSRAYFREKWYMGVEDGVA